MNINRLHTIHSQHTTLPTKTKWASDQMHRECGIRRIVCLHVKTSVYVPTVEITVYVPTAARCV